MTKATNKGIVIDNGVDTTPRRSALINSRAQVKSLHNLHFSEPLAKGFVLDIPALSAGEVKEYRFNLGNVGNPDVALIVLYTTAYSVSDIESFASGTWGYKMTGMGTFTFTNGMMDANISSKYTGGYGNVHSTTLRITEDYTESRFAWSQRDADLRYDAADTLMPSGFSYGDMGVGVAVGFNANYFGSVSGIGNTDAKVVLQASYLENDGGNTEAVFILKNVDTVANTATTCNIGFYL